MMTLLDEYSRQSLAIQAERQLTANQVLVVLWQAMASYGIPGYICSDTGPILNPNNRYFCIIFGISYSGYTFCIINILLTKNFCTFSIGKS